MIFGRAFRSSPVAVAWEREMISQMNLVQNAARMAMDHRAARPMKRSVAVGAFPAVFLGAAIIGVLAVAALVYAVT